MKNSFTHILRSLRSRLEGLLQILSLRPAPRATQLPLFDNLPAPMPVPARTRRTARRFSR